MINLFRGSEEEKVKVRIYDDYIIDRTKAPAAGLGSTSELHGEASYTTRVQHVNTRTAARLS